MKRVKLGEEHRWTALVEGDDGFQWRKKNKKKELGRDESKRKRSMEDGSSVDTLGSPVSTRLRCNSCRVFFRFLLKDVRLWRFLMGFAVLWLSLN